MKVEFEAQIMLNTIKSLRSMDKEARLLLEYSAEDDELMNKINKLHSAENTVTVVIMKSNPILNKNIRKDILAKTAKK